jgi:lysozyme family protein
MGFETAIEFVLSYEGGYSNDPADPGGETRWGISKRAYPDLNIKTLTREAAIALYRRDYWERCRCDALPPAIAFLLFDSAVNQGAGKAIRIMQQALGVAADGVIGSATINAASKAKENVAVAEFVARRCAAYAMTPNVQRFGLGWMRRAIAAHQSALGIIFV